MADKEIQKKTSSMDVIGPVIYIIIYVIVTLFIPKIGQLGGPLQGIVSQLLLLFSAFAVVAFPRYGYFAAIGANIFQIVMTALATIRAIQHGGTASALTGLITSVATIILATIIHVFYRRIVKNNEELVNANKILKAKDEKLTYLAYYDILTSLPNRQLFIEKIDETITSSQSFTVIAANIDNFKDINNELGNNAGDAVLCSYSKKLKKLCGNSIFLARINGDEFGFILFGNESETEILNYIDTIKEVISEPIKFNDVKLNITMSYGVAIYPINATDSTEMLKCVSS
ncbi:MAG: GGDEF domain-containing protein, partial [Oscillospiraceae bacterium]|nr:GGDEF domain-containing protein [Oscillospiraceae bacterium]